MMLITVVQSLQTPPRLQEPSLEEQQGGWIKKLIYFSMHGVAFNQKKTKDLYYYILINI